MTTTSLCAIAQAARDALTTEALLQPKPGLVDPRNRSAHQDMTVATLLSSAAALEPTFAALAESARGVPCPDVEFRAHIGAIARRGEARMLAATGGVNTHRGALWLLGLLCCGFSAVGDYSSPEQAFDYAKQLAVLPDKGLPELAHESHGQVVYRKYGVLGARGEAQHGFRHVGVAYKILEQDQQDTTLAQLTALLTIMSIIDDTCLLYRGTMTGLRAVQQHSRAVLRAGGLTTSSGKAAFRALDDYTFNHGLSPGGSGDILAAAIFTHYLISERSGILCRS